MGLVPTASLTRCRQVVSRHAWMDLHVQSEYVPRTRSPDLSSASVKGARYTDLRLVEGRDGGAGGDLSVAEDVGA